MGLKALKLCGFTVLCSCISDHNSYVLSGFSLNFIFIFFIIFLHLQYVTEVNKIFGE